MPNTPPWPTVLGSCYPPCAERFIAICQDEFGPAKSLGGWIFRDGPYRQASWKDWNRARYYGIEDHTGQPYIWVSCPWCGKDLAPPPDDEGLETDDGC